MPVAAACPPMETMARFILGQLPPADSRGVLQHLKSCARCAAMFADSKTGAPAAPVAEELPIADEEPARADESPAPATVREAPRAAAPNRATVVDTPPGPDRLDDYSYLRPPQSVGEIGRLGPYRVLEELGQGGMGIVFRAEDPSLGRVVALKILKPEFGAEEESRLRFMREARAVGAIEHENIVAVYQVGEDRGIPYLAMQFLKGETLADRLNREDRLPINEVLRIGREMTQGLAAAHAVGIVHRDIKPGNVWLEGARGRVKILDFGLARAADDQHLTRTGTVVGTPAYMSPEQAAGRTVGPRSDLFSLGSVLYHMCTGRPPFEAPDELAMMVAVATERPRAITELNKNVPELLVRLIVRLLAKHPDDRPQSATQTVEMLDIVAREIGPGPVDAQRPLPGMRVPRPAGGGSSSLVPIVLAVVLAVAAFAGYFYKDELRKLVAPAPTNPATPQR